MENSRILDFEEVSPTFHHSVSLDDNTNNNNTNNNNYEKNEQQQQQEEQQQQSSLSYFPYDKQVIFRQDSQLKQEEEEHGHVHEQLQPILVCGGDMWDKGGSDLYVTRQLLSLQDRYGPDRVHFILGNRDVNKMRILEELGFGTSGNGISSSGNGNGGGGGGGDYDDDDGHHCHHHIDNVSGDNGELEDIEMEEKTIKTITKTTKKIIDYTLVPPSQRPISSSSSSSSSSPPSSYLSSLSLLKGIEKEVEVEEEVTKVIRTTKRSKRIVSTDNALPFHNGVYWLKKTGLVGDPDLIEKAKDFLQKITKNSSMIDQGDSDKQIDTNNERQTEAAADETTIPEEYAQALQAMVPNSSAADRLRWMLEKTMGSPDAFELRRSELQREQLFCSTYGRKKNKGNGNSNTTHETELNNIKISDDDVVASYKSSTHPVYGEMGHYLKRGKLGLCLGGALFMHGSLPFTPNFVAEHLQKSNNCYDNNSCSSGSNGGEESNDCNSILDEKFWLDFYQYAMPFAGKNKSGYDVENVRTTAEWVDALNSFARDQTMIWSRTVTAAEEKYLKDHCMDNRKKKKKMDVDPEPMWSSTGGYQNITSEGNPAFGSLNQYGMGWLPFPGREKNPTVIYDSWLVEGMPLRFYENSKEDAAYRKMVCDFLARSNIDVIVTGHQPGKV